MSAPGPRKVVVDGIVFVPERPEDRPPAEVYVNLATRLLLHPDVIRALAIRLEAEGL